MMEMETAVPATSRFIPFEWGGNVMLDEGDECPAEGQIWG